MPADTTRSPRSIPGSAALLGAALLVLLVHEIALFGRHVDDAWISYRYARNLAEGLGPVFNSGERVEGYTNFLLVLFEAAFIRLGLSPDLGAKLLCMAASLATLVVVHRAARRWYAGDSARAAIPALLLAVSPAYAQSAVTGLETQLFTFLVTLGLVFAVEESDRRPVWSRAALVLGLSSLARPEGLLFGAVGFGYRLARRALRRELTAADLAWPLGFLAVVVPHAAFRLLYYGDWVPNTFHAKTAGIHPSEVFFGLQYLRDWANYAGGTVVAGLVFLSLLRGARAWNTLLLAAALPYLAYVATLGGDWMPRFRFVVPVLPAGAILIGSVLCDAWDQWVRPAVASRAARRLALGGLAAAYLLPQAIESAQLAYLARADRASAPERWRRARALESMTAAGDAIALMPIGFIGWATRRRIVDFAGLTDPALARRFDADYVFARNPKLIVLGTPRDPARGTFEPGWVPDATVAADDRFRMHYRLVDCWPPAWAPSAKGAVLLTAPGYRQVGVAGAGAYWLCVYARDDSAGAGAR
ncbi:MAG TPA: hypothetical protein VGK89_06330 [Candidatus Eisenbacteria bacterium]